MSSISQSMVELSYDDILGCLQNLIIKIEMTMFEDGDICLVIIVGHKKLHKKSIAL